MKMRGGNGCKSIRGEEPSLSARCAMSDEKKQEECKTFFLKQTKIQQTTDEKCSGRRDGWHHITIRLTWSRKFESRDVGQSAAGEGRDRRRRNKLIKQKKKDENMLKITKHVSMNSLVFLALLFTHWFNLFGSPFQCSTKLTFSFPFISCVVVFFFLPVEWWKN